MDFGSGSNDGLIKDIIGWASKSGRNPFASTAIKPDPNGAPNDLRHHWQDTKQFPYSNCYEMAMYGTTGVRDETFAAPGNAAGYFYPIHQLNDKTLIALVEADGKATGTQTTFAGTTLPPTKDGHYVMAAYLTRGATGNVADYHFIRRNQDGTWVGKAGGQPAVTYQTIFDSPVADAPATIGLPGVPSYQKVGYFYVKQSGGNVGADVMLAHLADGTYQQGPTITGADGKPIASVPNGASIRQAVDTIKNADPNSRFTRQLLELSYCDVPESATREVQSTSYQVLGVEADPTPRRPYSGCFLK